MMTFATVLNAIARQLDLDPAALIAYAAEDPHIGSQPDHIGTDPTLIPWEDDGRLLYALVRALKPQHVLESGCNRGGSANHLAAALLMNGAGQLTTVDVNPSAGDAIESIYAHIVEVIHTDICEYVQWPTATGFDFIHEDASHEVHTVRCVYDHLPTLAPMGAVVLSHDVNTGVGEAIRTGMHDAGYDAVPEYHHDRGPLGFSVLRYGGRT